METVPNRSGARRVLVITLVAEIHQIVQFQKCRRSLHPVVEFQSAVVEVLALAGRCTSNLLGLKLRTA